MDENKTLIEETAVTPENQNTVCEAECQAPVTEEAVTPAEETAAPAEEVAAVAEAEAAPAEENAVPQRRMPATKQEVIERLKEIAGAGEGIDRAEVEGLKQAYYKIHNAEAAAARDAFVEAGGAPEEFMPAPDSDEENFKAQLARIRELRAEALEMLEKEKLAGLEKKLAIIEQIKNMATSPDEADRNYDAFKQLQADWKEVKTVPAERATELWKNYQHYVEQYYDQLRLNHEMRAYDFKKNLEIKTRLCEAAEKLAEVPDPVSAFHQLQQLHQEFRETGPVEKEKREEVWTRFKEASTAVNKRHQQHFEALKAREEENLVAKTAFCEKAEAIAAGEYKGTADWEEATKQVLALQAEWKTVGYTPKKVNTKIFERFRAACDAFFTAKTAYFKGIREAYAANLEKKNELCAAAEALKESTDWNATANKLIALQKEWKQTGPVNHRASENVWKRFNEACNYFFDRKNAATAGQREEEEANLEKKNAIIAQLEQLLAAGEDNVLQAVRQLQAEWNEVGHVPFRKKEKMYKRYREVCDRLYKELHIGAGRRNLENFKRNVADKEGNELTRERNRLSAAYEAKKQEITNYETNLTFLNMKSKTAGSLVEEINHKIERLKEDLNLILDKIRAVNEQIKAAQQQD